MSCCSILPFAIEEKVRKEYNVKKNKIYSNNKQDGILINVQGYTLCANNHKKCT